MGWTNFHTHCHFCDGVGKPEDYIEEAIKLGIKALGFSCHASLPHYGDWTMSEENQKLYAGNIRKLQETYRGKIDIKLGLEIDYIPIIERLTMLEYKESMGLDYSIGAVHFIDRTPSGKYIFADSKEKNFLMGVEEAYNGDVRKAVEVYYHAVQDMVSLGGFDIVAHLDLIKKNNRNGRFFSEKERWYIDLVEDTLLIIANRGVIVEVNTGGISRNYIDTPYPSPWILKKCFDLNIPITLNSDAHSPSDIISYFSSTAKLLLDIGFTHLHVLENDIWKPHPFSTEGLL